jgi:NADH:ubiquinone oxidoreductase subunit 2 (subunit N)
MQAATGPAAVGLVVVGIVFVVYGLALVIGAATDFRHWMSNFYETNKGRKTGFVAISATATRYRTYVGVAGAATLIFGILAILNS